MRAGVDVRCKNAPPAQTAECQVKSADSAEQINECKRLGNEWGRRMIGCGRHDLRKYARELSIPLVSIRSFPRRVNTLEIREQCFILPLVPRSPRIGRSVKVELNFVEVADILMDGLALPRQCEHVGTNNGIFCKQCIDRRSVQLRNALTPAFCTVPFVNASVKQH